MAQEAILRDVRISFPVLFKPEEYKGDGRPNYSAKFFVEPGSAADKAIKEAIQKVAQDKWPEDWKDMIEEFRMDKKAFCYIDGKRVKYAGAAGHWVLTAKRRASDGRPKVVDKNPKIELTANDGKPYSGSYVNVKVEFWAQDDDAKGIRCTLATVQYVRDGESFGGARPADTDGFDDLSDSGDADDLI